MPDRIEARRVVRVALVGVLAVAVVIAFAVVVTHRRSRTRTRSSHALPFAHSRFAQSIVAVEARLSETDAPFHLLISTSPDAVLQRGSTTDAFVGPHGERLFKMNLVYRTAGGGFHIWMASRDWAARTIGRDLATSGPETTINGTVWHRVALGSRGVQLARATSDGAVIEVDASRSDIRGAVTSLR